MPIEAPHPIDDPRYPVRRSEAQWRAQLDAQQFRIAREAATERPFSGRYWDHRADGVYTCIGCGAELFDSRAKYDAGCGWPSWWQALDEAAVERLREDSHGMQRIELRCRRCGSHLGHVFDDGPPPSGERFCINSASLDFRPR